MKKCDHVVIFGIDAVGTYLREANTPNIDRIFGDGATTYRALCSRPSGSPEGWGSILTGTSADCHNLYWPLYDQDSTRLQETIFSYVRHAIPDAVMGSFCDWRDINDYFLEEGIGIHKKNVPEEEVVKNACDFLLSQKPTLLFTYFEAPDDMGHTYGWGTVPFYDSIERCDRNIGQMYAAAEQAGMTKENTLFLLVTDHGGIEYAHGCWHDLEKFVFLGAAGAGVQKVDLGQINIRDVAAMVLYALGIPLPEYDEKGWTAQIPKGLFGDGSGDSYKQVVRLHRNLPEQLPGNTEPVHVKEETGLARCFGEVAPVLALTFDGEIADEAGNYTPIQCYRDGEPIANRKYGGKGTRHVPGGIRGDCLLCDCDGYLAIPQFQAGSGSFSAAFWFYLDTELTIAQSLDTVFSNSKYADREADGIRFLVGDSQIRLFLNSNGISAKLGRNEDSMHVNAHRVPEEFDGGWMHLVVSVDRENRLYRLFCGFKELGSEQIPAALDGQPLDGCGTLRIGQQVSAIGACSNRYKIDDFLWFDRALDEADVEKLSAYYYGA